MSKLLEQIIRNILTEDSMVLGIEPLQAEDLTFINSQIRTPLGIASKDMNFYNLGGTRITLKRVGYRDKDDVTGKRSREITPNEFQTNVVLKLNALRGGYLPMTGPDYVWIITGDLKTDAKRDARNPKSDRIIAKYYSVATYVKTSLIAKTLTNTMKGYIFKLNGGALVFNLEDVNFNEWTREINIEPVTLANAPYVTVAYGDESRVVRELYTYFNLESSLFNYTVQNKFGCELKGAIQQFQTENGLTVTGDYDNATMKFATSLKKKEYVFKYPAEVKQFVNICQRENRSVVDYISDIVVPKDGFKFKETADNNEFYKVQAAMIKFLNDAGVPNLSTSLPTNTKVKKTNNENKKKNTNNKKMKDALSLLETALTNQDNRGDYGEATQAVVGICKNILINGLKISLTNTTNNFVDQQFVDELTKKRQL